MIPILTHEPAFSTRGCECCSVHQTKSVLHIVLAHMEKSHSGTRRIGPTFFASLDEILHEWKDTHLP